jgi:hypothetical protein
LKAINPDLKVAYHSDGNIYPIIPDLIEIGLDVLNPVQPAIDGSGAAQAGSTATSYASGVRSTSSIPCHSAHRQEVAGEVYARLDTVGARTAV